MYSTWDISAPLKEPKAARQDQYAAAALSCVTASIAVPNNEIAASLLRAIIFAPKLRAKSKIEHLNFDLVWLRVKKIPFISHLNY